MEFENILTLIKAVSESEITDFEYEENGTKINIGKKQKQIVSDIGCVPLHENGEEVKAKAENMVGEAKKTEAFEALNGNIIKSPLVGTFYAAPAQDAEAYVKIGDAVKKGQTLAIIEAMKLMNEIESEYDGNISEIYVENGQAIEYGQPLFKVS